MLREVQICSNSLVLLGLNPINSFSTDSSAQVTTCKVLFLPTLENELASYPWNFSLSITKLNLIDPYYFEWNYCYLLPVDMLRNVRVFNKSYKIIEDFRILNDMLLTNQSEAYLEFVKRPDINKLPSYFTYYFELKFASILAFALTEKPDKALYFQQLAEKQFTTACLIDSQNISNQGIDLNYIKNSRS